MSFTLVADGRARAEQKTTTGKCQVLAPTPHVLRVLTSYFVFRLPRYSNVQPNAVDRINRAVWFFFSSFLFRSRKSLRIVKFASFLFIRCPSTQDCDVDFYYGDFTQKLSINIMKSVHLVTSQLNHAKLFRLWSPVRQFKVKVICQTAARRRNDACSSCVDLKVTEQWTRSKILDRKSRRIDVNRSGSHFSPREGSSC